MNYYELLENPTIENLIKYMDNEFYHLSYTNRTKEEALDALDTEIAKQNEKIDELRAKLQNYIENKPSREELHREFDEKEKERWAEHQKYLTTVKEENETALKLNGWASKLATTVWQPIELRKPRDFVPFSFNEFYIMKEEMLTRDIEMRMDNIEHFKERKQKESVTVEKYEESKRKFLKELTMKEEKK